MITKEMLKNKILSTGLTYKQFANKVGVSHGFIIKLIRHAAMINTDNPGLKTIAKVLNLDYRELMFYIQKSKYNLEKLEHIEDYIPRYPKSITIKELTKIFGVDCVKIIAAITSLETKEDIRVAALDDKDSVFARVK